LPDGIFLNQKSKFGLNFEGLGMEKSWVYYMAIGIYNGHLVYFMAICDFAAISPISVNCVKKNLATLMSRQSQRSMNILTLPAAENPSENYPLVSGHCKFVMCSKPLY
jgi:hypothetical protein